MSEKNKRLIYSVLQKISRDRSFIEQSFKLWYSQHDSSELINLESLITFFEQEIGLNQDEKRIFRIAFYSAKSRSVDELPLVPRILTASPQDSQNTRNVSLVLENSLVDNLNSLSSEEYTFTVFINNLLSFAKKVDDDSLVDIIEFFSDKKFLSKTKFSNHTSQAILKWTGQDLNENIEASGISKKDMRNIFHNVYISICESLGPVNADRILSNSINKTDEDSRTSDYPSSKFI